MYFYIESAQRVIVIIRLVKTLCASGAALLLLLTGCGRDIQNTAAVQKGVVEYLKNRPGLSMDNMDVDVLKVSFRKDQADATVAIRVKGSTDARTAMQMQYTLERKGNGWVVKGKDSKGDAHGGTAMPGGPIPGGEMPTEMPPGHPATSPKGPA